MIVISVHYSCQLQLNTGDMSSEPTRSEEVMSDFKQHKLARSALRRIQDLILGFEEERVRDRQLARVGLFIVVVLVSVALFYLFSGDNITLR